MCVCFGHLVIHCVCVCVSDIRCWRDLPVLQQRPGIFSSSASLFFVTKRACGVISGNFKHYDGHFSDFLSDAFCFAHWDLFAHLLLFFFLQMMALMLLMPFCLLFAVLFTSYFTIAVCNYVQLQPSSLTPRIIPVSSHLILTQCRPHL